MIISDSGAVITTADLFTYVDAPVIFSVSPESGRGDAEVVILVTVCAGGSDVVGVTLAGQNASITSSSCNRVVVEAADYGTNVTGDVVLTSDTGSTATASDSWTYLADGLISEVTPIAGQSGTVVTIIGERLLGGGSGTPSVPLSGVEAFVQTGFSDNHILAVCIEPSEGDPDGLGDVVITGSTGVVTRLVDSWTNSRITSISPSSGQRGTIITIEGIALLAGGTDASTNRFASAPVAEVLTANNSVITAAIAAVNLDTEVLQSIRTGLDITVLDGCTCRAAGNVDSITPSSYPAATGTVTFAAGETTAAITLQTTFGSQLEDEEDFTCVLSTPVGLATGDGTETVAIIDKPGVIIGDDSVLEGDQATLIVALSRASSEEASVSWSTVDGMAQQPSDCPAATGAVAFAAGETTATITLQTTCRSASEDEEDFTYVLSTPVGLATGDGTGTVAIIDKQPAAVSIGDDSVLEGDQATLIVTLTGPSSEPTSVSYSTVDGTAQQPSDYAAATGTVTGLQSPIVAAGSGFAVDVTLRQPSQMDGILPQYSLQLTTADGRASTVYTGTGRFTSIGEADLSPFIPYRVRTTVTNATGATATSPATFATGEADDVVPTSDPDSVDALVAGRRLFELGYVDPSTSGSGRVGARLEATSERMRRCCMGLTTVTLPGAPASIVECSSPSSVTQAAAQPVGTGGAVRASATGADTSAPPYTSTTAGVAVAVVVVAAGLYLVSRSWHAQTGARCALVTATFDASAAVGGILVADQTGMWTALVAWRLLAHTVRRATTGRWPARWMLFGRQSGQSGNKRRSKRKQQAQGAAGNPAHASSVPPLVCDDDDDDDIVSETDEPHAGRSARAGHKGEWTIYGFAFIDGGTLTVYAGQTIGTFEGRFRQHRSAKKRAMYRLLQRFNGNPLQDAAEACAADAVYQQRENEDARSNRKRINDTEDAAIKALWALRELGVTSIQGVIDKLDAAHPVRTVLERWVESGDVDGETVVKVACVNDLLSGGAKIVVPCCGTDYQVNSCSLAAHANGPDCRRERAPNADITPIDVLEGITRDALCLSRCLTHEDVQCLRDVLVRVLRQDAPGGRERLTKALAALWVDVLRLVPTSAPKNVYELMDEMDCPHAPAPMNDVIDALLASLVSGIGAPDDVVKYIDGHLAGLCDADGQFRTRVEEAVRGHLKIGGGASAGMWGLYKRVAGNKAAGLLLDAVAKGGVSLPAGIELLGITLSTPGSAVKAMKGTPSAGLADLVKDDPATVAVANKAVASGGSINAAWAPLVSDKSVRKGIAKGTAAVESWCADQFRVGCLPNTTAGKRNRMALITYIGRALTTLTVPLRDALIGMLNGAYPNDGETARTQLVDGVETYILNVQAMCIPLADALSGALSALGAEGKTRATAANEAAYHQFIKHRGTIAAHAPQAMGDTKGFASNKPGQGGRRVIDTVICLVTKSDLGFLRTSGDQNGCAWVSALFAVFDDMKGATSVDRRKAVADEHIRRRDNLFTAKFELDGLYKLRKEGGVAVVESKHSAEGRTTRYTLPTGYYALELSAGVRRQHMDRVQLAMTQGPLSTGTDWPSRFTAAVRLICVETDANVGPDWSGVQRGDVSLNIAGKACTLTANLADYLHKNGDTPRCAQFFKKVADDDDPASAWTRELGNLRASLFAAEGFNPMQRPPYCAKKGNTKFSLPHELANAIERACAGCIPSSIVRRLAAATISGHRNGHLPAAELKANFRVAVQKLDSEYRVKPGSARGGGKRKRDTADKSEHGVKLGGARGGGKRQRDAADEGTQVAMSSEDDDSEEDESDADHVMLESETGAAGPIDENEGVAKNAELDDEDAVDPGDAAPTTAAMALSDDDVVSDDEGDGASKGSMAVEAAKESGEAVELSERMANSGAVLEEDENIKFDSPLATSPLERPLPKDMLQDGTRFYLQQTHGGPTNGELLELPISKDVTHIGRLQHSIFFRKGPSLPTAQTNTSPSRMRVDQQLKLGSTVVIGRNPPRIDGGTTVVLEPTVIKRKHLSIRYNAVSATAEVKSHGEVGTYTGHVFVNGKMIPVQQWVSLSDQSMLGVGATAAGRPLYVFKYATTAGPDDESATHFPLADPMSQISRDHLSIEFQQGPGTFEITDLGSKNGTYISGEGSTPEYRKIESGVPQSLQVGQIIAVGGCPDDGATAFRLMERPRAGPN